MNGTARRETGRGGGRTATELGLVSSDGDAKAHFTHEPRAVTMTF